MVTQHRWLLALALLFAAIHTLDSMRPILSPAAKAWMLWLAVGSAVAWTISAWLSWRSRIYRHSPCELSAQFGVIARARVEITSDRIQHAVLTQSWLERFLGLGTIGVSTAGADGPAMLWRMIEQPWAALERVRAEMTRRSGPVPSPPKFCIIGLAGTIGAGKSTVASILEHFGYAIADSDAQAKAELDAPDVREQLIQWWGPGVLDAEGRISRRAVAEIVFRDPSQRTRLENLIHPRLAALREGLKARAQAEGKFGLVIDAPLLFEAGLHHQCDAVLVVDAPRSVRLERVKASRGWSDEELARREAAQWPADRKRAHASAVIENNGDLAGLKSKVMAEMDRLGLAYLPTRTRAGETG